MITKSKFIVVARTYLPPRSPKEVGGGFYCWSNSKQFTEEEVREVSNVQGSIIFDTVSLMPGYSKASS